MYIHLYTRTKCYQLFAQDSVAQGSFGVKRVREYIEKLQDKWNDFKTCSFYIFQLKLITWTIPMERTLGY